MLHKYAEWQLVALWLMVGLSLKLKWRYGVSSIQTTLLTQDDVPQSYLGTGIIFMEKLEPASRIK